MCILVVVRQFVHYERFIGYRADMSCFATKMCLFETIQIDRCDAFVCLTLLSSNLNANIVFVRAALLLCGSLYIMNALSLIEHIWFVLRLKCVYSVLSRSTNVVHLFA